MVAGKLEKWGTVVAIVVVGAAAGEVFPRGLMATYRDWFAGFVWALAVVAALLVIVEGVKAWRRR